MAPRSRKIALLTVAAGIIAALVAARMLIPHVLELRALEKLQSSTQRDEALEYLARIKSKKAVPEILHLIRESTVFASYTNALTEIGPAGIPELIKALDDTDSNVRRGAALALGNIGAEDAVRPVATMLVNDDDPEARVGAAAALMKLGTKAHAAVPELRIALDDPNTDYPIRWFAAHALWRIGAKAKSAVPRLFETLHEPLLSVRVFAALAILSAAEDEEEDPRVLEVLRRDFQAFKVYTQRAEEWVVMEAEDLLRSKGLSPPTFSRG